MKNKLTAKDRLFLREYSTNGKSIAKAKEISGISNGQAYRLIKSELAQAYIANLSTKATEKMVAVEQVNFSWKLLMLKRAAEGALDAGQFAALVSAIAEMNKMQGDHSAEKRINANLNIDADLERVNRILEELVNKYKQEY